VYVGAQDPTLVSRHFQVTFRSGGLALAKGRIDFDDSAGRDFAIRFRVWSGRKPGTGKFSGAVEDLGEARAEGGKMSEPIYRKLKPGPGKRPAEVEADQRRRIRGATIEVVHKDGYQEFTISDVIAAAGVSRATFYRLYPGEVGRSSREQCFLDAYDHVLGCLARRLRSKGRRPGRLGLSARLGSLTGALADEPKAAHLALVEIQGAGQSGLRHADQTAARLQPLLRDGIAEGRADLTLPPLLLHGILAGIVRVSRSRLLQGRIADLRALAPQLARWALLFRDEELKKTARVPLAEAPRPAPAFATGREATSERARMLTAATKIVAAGGCKALSVPRIRRAAGVTRREFDAEFDDPIDCFLTAVDTQIRDGLGELRRDLVGPDWEIGLRLAIERLCVRLARDPVLAQTLFVDALAPGPVAVHRHADLIGSLAACLRGTLPAEQRPSELAMEASVGAAWGVIQHLVVSGQTGRLPERAGLITLLIAIPARDGALGEHSADAKNRCRSA
jgi:AcrR family transcriptional regulator